MNEDWAEKNSNISSIKIDKFCQYASKYVGKNYFKIRSLEFQLQRMLLPDLFTSPYKKVLELGCGIGFKAVLMKDFAEQVDGIDIDQPYHGYKGNESAVSEGQKIIDRIGCEGVQLTTGNYTSFLKKNNEKYDLIYSDYLMEHVPDLPALIRASYVALKPGGCFLNIVPNTHEALIQLAIENLQSMLRGLTRVGVGYIKRCFGSGGRHPKLSGMGTFVPITHSEFINDYRDQFGIYRLENYVYPMIEAGFSVKTILPTREHAFTVVCRKSIKSQ